jgi:uncharacterized protein (DUF2235 family)
MTGLSRLTEHRNFQRHVQDAYRWLADHYQPGDIIFLFGISASEWFIHALQLMVDLRFLSRCISSAGTSWTDRESEWTTMLGWGCF